MTGVMVQTAVPGDKVVATPVVFTTGAHGSRRAETFGGAADAVLRGLDVSVTMQRLCRWGC